MKKKAAVEMETEEVTLEMTKIQIDFRLIGTCWMRLLRQAMPAQMHWY